ncbi:Flp pilus assembly protein TadG [Roseovarius halotolerans]|uniref:von Willebrand factor type A domain protein n=2 Tax=Roseovarius halotolerans TaxID=505353 RepID=A0A1X6Y8I0_9RHOB|nr:Flp pilus assembly protein TadG [Roseovarius halotolerans]SLN13777.1 von Willebrand factor type A domain protein [Roseovarius halotolerans]
MIGFKSERRARQYLTAGKPRISKMGLMRALWRYRKDESGAVVALAIFIFIVMLVAAGLGIDTMRHEMTRTHIQSTLDSAVLAGAGAPVGATNEDIKGIVEDYFEAAGLQQYLEPIDPATDIDAGLNSKRVTASASMTMATLLMKLSGIDTLDAAATSTAAIASPKMEIVLALDVSGSMAGTRLAKMKEAAKEFAEDVMNNSDEGTTTISVVPYSWNVSPSPEMFDALSVNKTHNYSTCLDFTNDEFHNAAIDPNVSYAQTLYTSRYGSFGQVGSGNVESGSSSAYNRSCFDDDYFSILPYASTYAAVERKLDSLKAAGSTSADMGMKWASALLDPAFRPVVTSLQADRTRPDGNGGTETYNVVNPNISDLPALYTTGQVLKIIILMGDGANDWSYHLSDPNDLIDPNVPESHATPDYRGPNSNVYEITYEADEFQQAKLVNSSGSVIDYSNNESKCGTDVYEGYWIWRTYVGTWECDYSTEEHEGHYIYTPKLSKKYYDPARNRRFYSLSDAFSNVISQNRLSWEEAWGLMSPDWYGDISDDYVPDQQFDRYSSGSISPSDKDDRMSYICDAADAAGIVVFTIAFEMGDQTSAASKLANCASSDGNHYDATTVNIKQAFGSIAANVQKLRLTQ